MGIVDYDSVEEEEDVQLPKRGIVEQQRYQQTVSNIKISRELKNLQLKKGWEIRKGYFGHKGICWLLIFFILIA